MSTYSERLKNTLMVRLPGAGTDAVELEMGNAASEFFLESGAWHENVAVHMIAGRSRYDLYPSAGVVAFISDLSINGYNLTPISARSLPVNEWAGSNVFQVLTEFNSVDVTPTPTQNIDYGIKANVAVMPDGCTCDIPDDLVNHYFEALLDNSLAKLYSHVGKPYTNLSLATWHAGRYRAHLSRARAIVAGGNVMAGGPWVYPQIAPGKRRSSLFPRGA